MRSADITIDVSGTCGVDGPLAVAATVHAPDASVVPEVVAIAMPGGGYNRTYFDLQIPGHSGYSQAHYHTDRGWALIACDPIGTGDSSVPAAPHTIAQVAAVQAAAVGWLRDRLAKGTLADGLAAAPDAILLGLGQSMGGCFTIAAQGAHAPYDAVGILGFSARHTELPLPEGTFAQVPTSPGGGAVSQEDVAAALMASFLWVFHWDDVPADIAALDMASVPMRDADHVPTWGRRAASLPCGVDMLMPGIVAEQAAAIAVPVLIAQGERDVVPHPRDEPAAYSSSDHVTMVRIPAMAHMHNFASTRERMWRAIHAWGQSLLP
jgi:pimeloyl-ACP methyl ester carboxylesterase